MQREEGAGSVYGKEKEKGGKSTVAVVHVNKVVMSTYSLRMLMTACCV